MRKILTFLSIMATLVLFVACGNSKPAEGEQKKDGGEKQVAQSADVKKNIAVVYSTGGKGDKSFNDAVFHGLEKAKAELGIKFSEYEPKNAESEAKEALEKFAETGEYDLIIGVGFTMKESVMAAATAYPDQKFAIVDETITGLPNVTSLTFKEHEGSFLVGALAAMMSKTGTVGFIGGMENPVIQKFEAGFAQGAKYINPNIKVLTVYIGGSNAFNDPASAKTKSETLIQQKADVLYHAAGGSGAGVFQAAKEKNVYAIGVDSNQDDIVPGTILTSMMKYVDVATFNIVKDTLEGKYTNEHHEYGVKENGVGTTDFKNTKDKIGEENIKKLDQIKQDISDGKITVSPTVEGKK